MTMQANRVSVNRRIESRRHRIRPSQHRIPAAADREMAGEHILHMVAVRQPLSEAYRRAALVRPQYISEVLRVGIKPEVRNAKICPQQIARLNDFGAF